MSPQPPAPQPVQPPAVVSQPTPPAEDEDQLFQSVSTEQDKPFVPRAPEPVAQQAVVPLPVDPPKPTRPRRRLPLKAIGKVFFVFALAAGFGAGAFTLIRYERLQNDPTHVFDSALESALSTNQLESDTTVGSNSAKVNLDFTVPTNIQSSNEATVNLAGASAQIKGYGSAKNTYISYQTLPKGVSPQISSAAHNAWVKLRSDGKLPAGVSATLSNIADPRYQAFGPIVFGNFSSKTATQLMNYISRNNVYKFDKTKVTHTTKDGQAVLAYPVKLNISNLRILNYSAANSEGFSPGDVSAGVNKLENYKDAKVTIYITSQSHLFMGMDIALRDYTITIRYSHFDDVSLPAEPVTKLTWDNFSKIQLDIESQAASKQTPTQIDAQRQAKLANLRSALKTYFADTKAYPTYTQLNDQTWVQTNLAGLDPDNFHDPLATSLALSQTPLPNNFAYQPTAADGKSPCDNLTQNCDHFTLTAILSTAQPYAVKES